MRDSFSASEISSRLPSLNPSFVTRTRLTRYSCYKFFPLSSSPSSIDQTSPRFTRIYFKSRCTRFPRVSDYTTVSCSIFVIAYDFIATFTARRERINAASVCKIQVTENRLSRHPRADPTEGTSCTDTEGRNRCFQFFFIWNFLYPCAHPVLDKAHLLSTSFLEVIPLIRFDTSIAIVV